MSFFKQFRSIISKTSPTAEAEQKGTPHRNEQPSEPIERRSRKRLNSHKGRRVLIIDDSPTIVAVLKKILRSAGCITLEALDAEHGLEIVHQEKPDLVFLDIVLPGMNGFAALRVMRREPSTQHIPVIMISGNEQATEQFYAKRIGADDFMKKPFSRFEVFGRMDSLVELKKLAAIRPSESTSRLPGIRTSDYPATSIAPPVRPPVLPSVSPTQAAPATSAAAPMATPAPIAPMAVNPQQATVRTEAPAPQSHQRPQPGTPATPSPKPISPLAVSTPTTTPLEARSQLTAMGLQYFNQEQFLAALHRNDKLAIELFIAGGGVDINV